MARVVLEADDLVEETQSSDYFANQTSLEFIPSGAAVLDCVLGGGWPLTRISNIVGDQSTGKTLMAIEACANFNRKWPKGLMFYREAESAFDEDYAAALGMPVEAVSFIDSDDFVTIEQFYEDLQKACQECIRRDQPGLYVCDSLDALSSDEEQKTKFDAGSYAMGKPKQMGKLLRMCKSEIAKAKMNLIIISQTRDKIGSEFVAKTRSGGRALDFFASQVIWLSHRAEVSRQVNSVKRVVGVEVMAKCEKNKISLPRRRCEFTITFGSGIDSMSSSMNWLEDVKRWDEVFDVKRPTYKTRLEKMSDEEYWQECKRVDAEVVRIWQDVERDFLSLARPKYRD